MDQQQLLSLYRFLVQARYIDHVEKELTNRGEAFFHLSGAGHEAMAALAPHLTADDWLHCHYRDRALLLARGVSARSCFDNLFCNDRAAGRGRRMSPFMSDPALHILSMVTPTANNALQAVGVAAAVKSRPGKPIVYCGVGDGTTQQGEFLEAIAEAVREELPVLFVIQDNQWAISTPTVGRTFFSLPNGPGETFYGLPIHQVDGRDGETAFHAFSAIVTQVRETRGPAVVIFRVERLASHTNADDQTIYRTAEDLARAEQESDPIRIAEAKLLKSGMTQADLTVIQSQVKDQIAAAEAEAMVGETPLPMMSAKQNLPVELTHPSRSRGGSSSGTPVTMKDALRNVLLHHLREDERVTLFGEDIEDPKGDVFGITRGLSTQFPGRVMNSPLSESTIIGSSIGRALAGERPVAFLQFADFMPHAYNQIVNELATIYWRSDGRWTAPVIVMIACGGYRAGLGPYHAQTYESVLAHTPGLDVFMPSTAEDAAGLLNAAFKSERPTMMLYPKSCLNDPLNTTSPDVDKLLAPIGTARKARTGRDITLIGWGNTTSLCLRAGEALDQVGIETEVIDLRCISPWDEAMVLASAEKTARVIVAHEDNLSCGMGAEIVATIAEKTPLPVAVKRITRPDAFVPCNFSNQLEVLPSFKSILTAAAEMLDLKLDWIAPPPQEAGVCTIEAIGSGPSDETVDVLEIRVQVGELIQRGDVVATVEATKSVFDITSPEDGTVEEVFASEGQTVAVGESLVRLLMEERSQRARPVTQEQSGTPVLVRDKSASTFKIPHMTMEKKSLKVGLSQISVVTGSRIVTNEELLVRHAGMTPGDIVRRTGIERRNWAQDEEDAVNMAVAASWKLLDQERLIVDDLDLVICSTTTPTSVTPSMACRVLNGLSIGDSEPMIQAYDISAACSGYLYALQAGYDFLQSTPEGRVMVVTAEVLSPLLDMNDFDTAILFGDATTATLLYGDSHFDRSVASLHRPDLSAKGEDGSTLTVPLLNDGYIQMKGTRVFSEAVRAMISSLTRACDQDGITMDDLKMVVPHQANQRIIDAIQSRIKTQVFSNIRNYGNTSSSSIPLCLHDLLPEAKTGDRFGLCAFGGGFTFGAGIIEAHGNGALHS